MTDDYLTFYCRHKGYISLAEVRYHIGCKQLSLLHHSDLSCAIWMSDRRAAKLLDMLEAHIDQGLQPLDAFLRRAAYREPVHQGLINQREMRTFFLGMSRHIVL